MGGNGGKQASNQGRDPFTMTSKFLFDAIFQQIVQYAIEQSRVDEAADYELAFYKVERVGFAAGQHFLDKYFSGTHFHLLDCVQILKGGSS